MSQSYHLPETSIGSSNTPQTVPLGLAGANTTQATAMENTSTGDEMQNLSAGTDYPVQSSGGDSGAWTQDTQNEWMPGFGRMDPQTRRDALNLYLRTPKFTSEGIVRAFWQQQQLQLQIQQQMQSHYEAQKKGAERDAMEREMRLRAEQQHQSARSDRHGVQSRRL